MIATHFFIYSGGWRLIRLVCLCGRFPAVIKPNWLEVFAVFLELGKVIPPPDTQAIWTSLLRTFYCALQTDKPKILAESGLGVMELQVATRLDREVPNFFYLPLQDIFDFPKYLLVRSAWL